MSHVLIASDAQWVHDEIRSALGSDATVTSVSNGAAVRPAVKASTPSVAVLDSQIAAMGGIAATIDLHNEESGGRLPHVPVLLLLDRQADVFLAGIANAEGYLVKPLDALRVRKALKAVLAGETYADRVQTGDASNNYKPTPDATAR